jgi:hypothetical protein
MKEEHRITTDRCQSMQRRMKGTRGAHLRVVAEVETILPPS